MGKENQMAFLNVFFLVLLCCVFFFKILFIYLLIRDTEKEREAQKREKQAPCRDPDVGLDSRSAGSGPGLKAVLNC